MVYMKETLKGNAKVTASTSLLDNAGVKLAAVEIVEHLLCNLVRYARQFYGGKFDELHELIRLEISDLVRIRLAYPSSQLNEVELVNFCGGRPVPQTYEIPY